MKYHLDSAIQQQWEFIAAAQDRLKAVESKEFPLSHLEGYKRLHAAICRTIESAERDMERLKAARKRRAKCRYISER